MLQFDGESIYLKEFSKVELEGADYYSWLRSYEVVRNIYRMEYLKPISTEAIQQYVENVLKSPNDAFFAIYTKKDQKFIGTLKIGHINWHSRVCDLGIMIGDPSARGKGYSKEALILGCKYALNVLSLRKVTGGVFEDNEPMIRAFKGVGFVEEGRKRQELLVEGKYIDHLLFGLLENELKS